MIQIKVRETCHNPKCEKGYIYDPHCTQCNKRIPHDHPFWRQDTDKLPCGHPIRKLVEEYECPTCRGSTWVEGWAEAGKVFDEFRQANQLLQKDLAMVHDLNRTQAQEIEKLRRARK